jgi:hypothetical protein
MYTENITVMEWINQVDIYQYLGKAFYLFSFCELFLQTFVQNRQIHFYKNWLKITMKLINLHLLKAYIFILIENKFTYLFCKHILGT